MSSRGEARGDAVAVLVHARPRHGGPPLDAARARRAPDEPSEARAKVLYGAGYLAARARTRTRRRSPCSRRALRCAKEVGATATAAIAAVRPLLHAAETRSSTRSLGGWPWARKRSLSPRAAGDDFVLAIALNNLGGVIGDARRGPSGRPLTSRRAWRPPADRRRSRIALSLANVAEMALQEGKTARRPPCSPRRPRSPPRSATSGTSCFALAGLGRVAYREERWEDAARTRGKACASHQELGKRS